MPVKYGRDKYGPFFRWGHQHKYYYTSGNKKSRLIAFELARRQGNAIFKSGYKPKYIQ